MEATAAALCFGGGIIAGLVGSIMTVGTWIIGAEQHPVIRGLGTAFLISTILLIILSGYCLDWMERDRKTPFDSPSEGPESVEDFRRVKQ